MGKIFANHVSDKELIIFRIYKNSYNLVTKTPQITQFKNGQMTARYISPKIHKLPIKHKKIFST